MHPGFGAVHPGFGMHPGLGARHPGIGAGHQRFGAISEFALTAGICFLGYTRFRKAFTTSCLIESPLCTYIKNTIYLLLYLLFLSSQGFNQIHKSVPQLLVQHLRS